MKKSFFRLGLCLLMSAQTAVAGKLLSVSVKTHAPENRNVTIYYRVPRGYDAKAPQRYRVLVIFGGRNCDGKGQAGGGLGFGQWADEHRVFLVAPGFRNDDYWHPERWSGNALLRALREIKKEHNICDDKLLFYGYSGGSQCSNLFPAWRPQLTRAWVSHACGVFHSPSVRMADVPGLVTCGDADVMRYIISRKFVEESREKGVRIIWKSFPNHPHDVPPDSLKLARAFLTHYHLRHIDDLRLSGIPSNPGPEKTEYVGDDQDMRFWRVDSPQARRIPPEDRVELPSREIALAWGAPDGEL